MRSLMSCAVLGASLLAVQPALAQNDNDRAGRWRDLQHAIFGARPVGNGDQFLKLEAPIRAQDAALVPVEITSTTPIKGLYLIIDDNPAPLAAHFSFGPAADTRQVRLRVRVDQYTEMHAVAEGEDGRLYAVADFVKAAGGCSAPAGASDAAALEGIGQMKLHTLDAVTAGKPVMAKLMIRHPDFNGMQMNQVTRYYTPARFINSVDVDYDGAKVFHMDSDISLSTDPAITFGFVPRDKGRIEVVARDSKGSVFMHSFPVPAPQS